MVGIERKVQEVAQIERDGRLESVLGIPVADVAGIGKLALTKDGLVSIRMSGMFWDNKLEGTHVFDVEKVSCDWDKIERVIGLSQGDVSGMFDEYERPKVEEPVKKTDQAFLDHWEMMQRAGDLR